jgi:hypothetical protein
MDRVVNASNLTKKAIFGNHPLGALQRLGTEQDIQLIPSTP